MTQQHPHRKVSSIAGTVAIIMFGFCFAMVPFYNVICKATGINTSIRTSELVTPSSLKSVPDLSREVTVQFVAMNNMGLPWDFYPKQTSVRVHPGENTKVYFYAKNATDKAMTVQAIPSMTPTDAMSHFHKIECFCFKQQSLNAHVSKDMALVFQVDKELPKEIHVITLAYTLFDATPKETSKKG